MRSWTQDEQDILDKPKRFPCYWRGRFYGTQEEWETEKTDESALDTCPQCLMPQYDAVDACCNACGYIPKR